MHGKTVKSVWTYSNFINKSLTRRKVLYLKTYVLYIHNNEKHFRQVL